MYIPHRSRDALKELGHHLRRARKRRQWTLADLARKMEVSSPTLIALEKGEPTVRVGVLISALWILGLEKELQLLSRPQDEVGEKLMNQRLPERVRPRKRSLDNDF